MQMMEKQPQTMGLHLVQTTDYLPQHIMCASSASDLKNTAVPDILWTTQIMGFGLFSVFPVSNKCLQPYQTVVVLGPKSTIEKQNPRNNL